jgi:TonB family protein
MRRQSVLVPFLHAGLSFALGSSLGAAGCASDTSGRADDSDRPAKHRRALAKENSFEKSAPAREMAMENEVGVYDTADIEETMAAHMDDVRGCYARAGKAKKFAGGKVMLRFLVSGEGKPQDVLVVANDLGNYDVERCLVDVGRHVKFPPPDGGKATTFEYPVEFLSTHDVDVQDLEDSLKIDRDVGNAMKTLASCGAVTPTGAAAVFYVDPRGAIASVGFAADSPMDEHAGACVVSEMRRWKMSASLPGRMLRCRANIPAVIVASAAAAPGPQPSRPATLSAAARKRRR